MKSASILFLFGLAVLLLGAGCTGKTGPAGPPGESGTVDCVQCHNDNTTLVAAVTQWETSKHASTELLSDTNRGTGSTACFTCHTSEGFVSNLAGAAAISSNPTPIGCRTCHAPHTNKDFRRRWTSPDTLLNGAIFDKGDGNLCARCHHSRSNINTLIAPAPDSTTVSTRFGPHEGPQAEAFLGTGGYEFGASVPSSPHKSQVPDACVSCHMFTPVGATIGGHSFSMADDALGLDNVAACNVTGCHADAPLTDFNRPATVDWDGDGTIEGTQDEFDGLLGQLRATLIAQGLLYGPGANVDLPTPGKRTADQAGALYDFRLALREGSRGIHNTKYIMTLMQRSLAHLAPPKNAS